MRQHIPELLMVLGAYRVYRFVVLSTPAAWCRRVWRHWSGRAPMPDWKHFLVYVWSLGRCRMCGRFFRPRAMQTDHWHRAHALGGSNSLCNLRALCGPDNRRKWTTPAARLVGTRT